MKLEGMPRNVSTHAAGVVLTKEPVTDYVPVQLTQDSNTVTVLHEYTRETGTIESRLSGSQNPYSYR